VKFITKHNEKQTFNIVAGWLVGGSVDWLVGGSQVSH